MFLDPPLGEMVLHDNDAIVAVMGRFKGTHQIYGDSLIESPIGMLLQLSTDSGFAFAVDGAVLAPRIYAFLQGGPVEPPLDESLHVDYTLVCREVMMMAGLEDVSTNHLGCHKLFTASP